MTYGNVLSVSTTYGITYRLWWPLFQIPIVPFIVPSPRGRVQLRHNVKPGEVCADEPAPSVPVRLQAVGGDGGPPCPPPQPPPGVSVRLQAVGREGGPARPPPQLPRLQAPSHRPDKICLETAVSSYFKQHLAGISQYFVSVGDVGSEPVFVDLLRSPGIDSQPGGSVRQPYLTLRPARQHRLAESIPALSNNTEYPSLELYPRVI